MKHFLLAPGLLLAKLLTREKKRSYRSPRQKPEVSPGLAVLSLFCWLALAGAVLFVIDKAGFLEQALDAGVEVAKNIDQPTPEAEIPPPVSGSTVGQPIPAAPSTSTSLQQQIVVEQWLVILHTIPKSGRDEAERRKTRYQNRGLGVDILDTDAFPRLKSGNWIITLGPFDDRDSAMKAAEKAKTFNSKLIVRRGM